MARIRTVKPEFYQDEDLATVSEPAFVLALGLLNYADDEGYFKAHPGLVKSFVFPLREPSVSVPVMLCELSDIGYLRLFTGTDGKQYGRITNFTKHQVISRPTPSKIKQLEPPYDDSMSPHGGLHAGKERKGKEQGKEQGSCAEPKGSTPAADDDTPTFITLPLNDKSEYPVTGAMVLEWCGLYPAVDVHQQLRNMRGWLDSNPAKRKTRNGIRRFITSWLNREQDRGGSYGPHQQSNSSRAKQHSDTLDSIAAKDFAENGVTEVVGGGNF